MAPLPSSARGASGSAWAPVICDQVTALAEGHGVTYLTVFDRESRGFGSVVTKLAL